MAKTPKGHASELDDAPSAYDAIRDPAQLEALAEPTRYAIYESLQHGPNSIRGIAEHLDREPGSLYRHIALLEAMGLVKRVGQVPTERRAAWIYAWAHENPAFGYAPDDPVALSGLLKIVDVMTQRASREFAEALEAGDVTLRGPERNALASQFQGWLNADELARLNELLGETIELLRAGTRRPDTQLVSLISVLRPPRTRSPGNP